MSTPINIQRRVLIRTAGAAAVASILGLGTQSRASASPQRPGGPVPDDEWWIGGGPHPAPSRVQVVSADEPGERLVLDGRVVDMRGRAAGGITVYIYQTDANGIYYLDGRLDAGPRIRGWANTDEDGRFEFATIRPGYYPAHTLPAHIHMTVSSPSMHEWWVPEVRFEGDPLISDEEYARSKRDGDYGNVRRLVHGDDGVLRCTRYLRI